MEAKLPDTTSAAAEQGTAVMQLQKLLAERLGARALSRAEVEVTVDQEMVDGVAVYVDFVNSLPGASL